MKEVLITSDVVCWLWGATRKTGISTDEIAFYINVVEIALFSSVYLTRSSGPV